MPSVPSPQAALLGKDPSKCNEGLGLREDGEIQLGKGQGGEGLGMGRSSVKEVPRGSPKKGSRWGGLSGWKLQ